MKIGIDLDDTINNLVEVWISKYNKDYNKSMNINDVLTWDIGRYSDIGQDFYKYLGDGVMFKELSIKPNASNTIKQLHKKHEIYIVTANGSYNNGVCDDKVNFVKKHLNFIDTHNIMFINDKSLLNLDILIDDGYHNLENFNGYKVLFSRPWNLNIDPLNYHMRLLDWGDQLLRWVDIIDSYKKREFFIKKELNEINKT